MIYVSTLNCNSWISGDGMYPYMLGIMTKFDKLNLVTKATCNTLLGISFYFTLCMIYDYYIDMSRVLSSICFTQPQLCYLHVKAFKLLDYSCYISDVEYTNFQNIIDKHIEEL